MFYIRLILLGFWLIICCITGLAKSLFRWGDTGIGQEFGSMFSRGALKITGITVEVLGREYLEAAKPCIYTLNHQSNFDMATFGNIYPKNTVIIGKKDLVWIPFFGLLYVAAGNIMIDRKKTDQAKGTLSQVVEDIKTRRVSVWAFPEGTRNRPGTGLLPFKKGLFHMAIAAQVPVVPLVSSSMITVADWKRRKLHGGKMQIRILPPVSTEGLTADDAGKLANEVREKMLAALSELRSIRKGNDTNIV